MLQAERQAEMIWHGNLARGDEKIKVGSGVVEHYR